MLTKYVSKGVSPTTIPCVSYSTGQIETDMNTYRLCGIVDIVLGSQNHCGKYIIIIIIIADLVWHSSYIEELRLKKRSPINHIHILLAIA